MRSPAAVIGGASTVTPLCAAVMRSRSPDARSILDRPLHASQYRSNRQFAFLDAPSVTVMVSCSPIREMTVRRSVPIVPLTVR